MKSWEQMFAFEVTVYKIDRDLYQMIRGQVKTIWIELPSNSFICVVALHC